MPDPVSRNQNKPLADDDLAIRLEVETRLRDLLTSCFPDSPASALTLAYVGRVAKSDNPIWFFDVQNRTTGQTRRLVAKHLRLHTSAADAVAREYSMLEAFHGHPGFESGGCCVPRPMVQWEDLRTLVMERAEGGRLTDRLRLGNSWFDTRSVQELSELMERCGQCLRSLHKLHLIDSNCPLAAGCAPLQELEQRLNTALEGHGIQSILPPRRRDTLERSVSVALTRLSGQKTELVRQHGDYALGNLLTDGNRLSVIDFAFSRPGLIHRDLSRFLVTLTTLNPYPRNPLYRFGMISQYRTRFLRGYFGDLHRISDQDRMLLCLYSVAALSLHFKRRNREYGQQGLGGRLYFFIIKQTYRRLIGRELQQLQDLLD